MPEWLYEAGIGEARAALVHDGAILRAEIERPGGGPRCGAVLAARFDADLVGRRAVQVRLDGGGTAFLDPAPRGFGNGATCTVEVVRERLGAKATKVRAVADDTPPHPGPTLRERIATDGWPVRELRAVGPDLLEAAGWSELLEEAQTGTVAFPGGRLLIERTEGMTVIDVDGALPADALALAGAAAAARAIGRLRLGGSIGIDLPTTSRREPRLAAAEAFDRAMAPGLPFERTAVNGWGFVQIVLPKRRPSLSELIAADPDDAASLALYRRAERDPRVGAITLRAHPAVMSAPSRTPANDADLARRRGAPVTWAADPTLKRWAGTVGPAT